MTNSPPEKTAPAKARDRKRTEALRENLLKRKQQARTRKEKQ